MAARLAARLGSPRVRLFVIFSLVTLVGLGALATVLALGARGTIERESRRNAMTLADALSRTAFGPLLAERDVALAERQRQFKVAAAAAEAGAPVLRVAVTDVSGQVVYSAERPGPRDGKRLDVRAPVRSGGRVIGAVQMELDYAPTAADIHKRVRDIWTIIGGAALLIYLALLPLVMRVARSLGQELDPESRALLGDFEQALSAGDQIDLVYQPIVEMSSGRVSAVEALARWTHPERGQVAPSDFVPIIESSDLLWPFTLHVLEGAVRQSAAWRSAGLELPVAVNLSAVSVVDERLPEAIQSILDRHGVAGRLLELEVTEAAIADRPERAQAVLSDLRVRGVGLVAIDDFGTGHSSLARLAILPVQALKIDRSSVNEMVARGDPALVNSIVSLAHNLSLRVVAEGVEDEKTWTELAGLGCDQAQGWFVARPLPAAAIHDWCRGHEPERLAALSRGAGVARERRTGMRRRREDMAVPAFDNAADAVFLLDDDGRYVFANLRAAEIYGVAPDKLVGQMLGRFTPADDRDQLEADFRTLRREGILRTRREIVGDDGRRRVVDFNIRADVLPGRHLAIGREIT